MLLKLLYYADLETNLQHSNKNKQQQLIEMIRSYGQRTRESSSMIHGNRRYIKKGISPQVASYIGPCIKSNQQLFSQLTPHLHAHTSAHTNSHAHSQQNRFTDKNVNNFTSTSKLANRDDLTNYQLYGLSSSKNAIYDNQRRKGKTSFHKKIAQMNSSQLFFGEPKLSTTKEISKISSQQQEQQEANSIDPGYNYSQNQVEEMHYRMVAFQQKCKNIVAN